MIALLQSCFLKPPPPPTSHRKSFGLFLQHTSPGLLSSHTLASGVAPGSTPPTGLLPYPWLPPSTSVSADCTTQKGCYHSYRKTLHYLKNKLSSVTEELGAPAQEKCPQSLAELNEVEEWRKEPPFIEYLLFTWIISLTFWFLQLNWTMPVKCLLSSVPDTQLNAITMMIAVTMTLQGGHYRLE